MEETDESERELICEDVRESCERCTRVEEGVKEEQRSTRESVVVVNEHGRERRIGRSGQEIGWVV